MPADSENREGQGEFDWIAQLLRPLTRGHPGALDLLDDAAFLTPTPGHDLVLTKDALVAGVHFLPDDPLETVGHKLLTVNLSDLAAKGAAPVGYLLSTAWPTDTPWSSKARFAEGLAAAGERWRLPLLGGDTVSTAGPPSFTATLIGEVPAGGMVKRSGARSGDLLQVSGPIGDGYLGLRAARGELASERLAIHYRRPEPRLDLLDTVRTHGRASADVSDGLLADAGHIAKASGLAVEVDLGAMPLSADATAWLAGQDARAARVALATGGDDYQLLIAAPEPVLGFVPVGRFMAGQGVTALFQGQAVPLPRLGWTHR